MPARKKNPSDKRKKKGRVKHALRHTGGPAPKGDDLPGGSEFKAVPRRRKTTGTGKRRGTNKRLFPKKRKR